MAKRIKKEQVKAPEAKAVPVLAKTAAFSMSALKKIESEIEVKVQKVRESYQKQIQLHSEELSECTELLEAFAQANRDSWGNRKSLDVTHGLIGFRIGNPTVKTPRGKGDDLLDLLDMAGMDAFIRQVKELDKAKIIASREDDELMGKLSKMGITVDQKETFFFEPKSEELQPK